MTVTFAPTAAQVYSTMLTITSDDPIDPSIMVDLTGTGLNSADFEFIKQRNLLVIPTFMGNKGVAYELSATP